MNHTPGPWTVEAVMGEHEVDICLNYGVPGEYLPLVIGCAIGNDEYGRIPDLKQTLANALLMAAAPDLLAACEAAMEEFEHLGQALGELFPLETAEVWNRIEAVVKKARGAP